MTKGRVKIVFQTPFYEPTYAEFYNPDAFVEFLGNLDFMRPHVRGRISAGMPEFRLGYRVEYIIDGEQFQSNVIWGPRFIAGQSVMAVDRSVLARVPADCRWHNDDVVTREYRDVTIPKGRVDAVINLDQMNQLWPPQGDIHRTELFRFLSLVNRERRRIAGRGRG